MAFNREKVIKSAEKYVAKGKIEHGIREYRKVLAENPNDANTLNRVGDLYARIERIDEAVKLFTQIAEQYTSDGFFVKAIAIYKKIIKLDPSSLQVYERLAELYHKQGLLNEARTQYQVLADYYQKHDNAASAISIFQRMADMEPENPSYRLKLADLYASQRLTEKALREYQILAELMIEEGTAEETAQVYYKAFDFNQAADIFFVRKAFDTLRDKDEAVAARILDRAVELNPEVADLRANLLQSTAVATPEVDATVPEPSEFDSQFPEVEDPAPEPPLFEDATPSPTLEEDDDGAFSISLEEDDGGGLEFDVSFDEAPVEAPQDEEDGVFTLDLEDDEVPETLVAPPSDMTNTIQGAGTLSEEEGEEEFEFVIEGFDDDTTPETLVTPPADLQDPAPVVAVKEDQEVEIDWSLDEMDLEAPELEVEATEALVEPVADIAEIDFVESVEPVIESVEPVIESFEAPSFAIDDALIEMAEPAVEIEPEAFEISVDEVTALAEDGDATVFAGSMDIAPFESSPNTEESEIEWVAGTPAADVEAGLFDLSADPDQAPPALEQEQPVPTAPPSDLAEGPTFSVESHGELAPFVVEDSPETTDLPTEQPTIDEIAASYLANEAAAIGATATEDEGGTAETAADLDATLPSLDAVADADAESVDMEPVETGGISPAVTRREDDLLAEAEVFFKYGLQDKSRDRLKELLELNPNHIAAMCLRVQIELKDGRQDEVLAQANEIVRLAPEHDEHGDWPQIRDRLTEAGYRFEGGLFTAAPKVSELASDNRIAQLLEDLDDEPQAAAGQSQKISLIDALGLDGLDEFDEEEEEAVAVSSPAQTEEDAAELLDETGMSWLDDVPGNGQKPASDAASDAYFDEEDDFFDLAAELQRELGDEELQNIDTGGIPQEQSLEEIIDGFKKGVAENLSAEDYETHFNLGIAYREMGLLDEAIGEFQLASKDDRYIVDCSSLLGMCFLEKGMPDLALRSYRKGLEAPGIPEEATMGLLYDMGSAYLSIGDSDAAYKTFVEIYGMNSNYRDISAKLEALQP